MIMESEANYFTLYRPEYKFWTAVRDTLDGSLIGYVVSTTQY